MSRNPFRFLVIGSILLCMNSSRSEQMKSSGSPELLESIRGTYSIIQLDKEIGTEKFSRKIFSNNTLIVESEMALKLADKRVLTEKIRMVLDEDSYFPRSYSSVKEVEGLGQEISVEMFANVARITRTSRSGDKGKENTMTRTAVLSAGSLFLQRGVVSHLDILLKRYNDVKRGPQNLIVFDPASANESTVLVRYAASLDTVITGKKKTVDIYKVTRQGIGSLRLYVDEEKRIFRVVDSFQRMEYVLTDFEALKD